LSGLGTQAWVALSAALALVLLTGLVETAMPVLRGRYRPRGTTRENLRARLRRQIGSQPRRARRATSILRTMLLLALLACVVLAPAPARLPVAIAAAAGLALLLTLMGNGWLRRAGRHGQRAAAIAIWLLAPVFLLLPVSAAAQPARRRDPEDTIADLADALATESAERQRMVEALLDLEQRTVEDVMVPRSEIHGIDVTSDWEDICARLRQTPHTRMPLYDGDLDRVQGIVHMRLVANELASGRLTRDRLNEIAARREAVFVPEGTTLYDQLVRFRRLRRRIAFVVDEYGDLQGLVTLEDILEEVVGEFTTQPVPPLGRISRHADGSYVVPGALTLREINRTLSWNLPTEGPRTLSGLIVEHLEAIPPAGARLTIGEYVVEVLQVADNAVRTVRIRQAASAGQASAEGAERF